MVDHQHTVVITGSSGFIGRVLIARFVTSFNVVGLDLQKPDELPESARFERLDLSSDDSVRHALARGRSDYGGRIASVIHLAAYFDLTGEPNPKYQEITVRGTDRLLRELQGFEVEQFAFASSMLVHPAVRLGELIDEDRPLASDLPYPASKIDAERLLHERRGSIPIVYMRPAGVYDDLCRNPFLAHQIARIYERTLQGHVYPGDLSTGQSFLHVDDLADAVLRLVERRKDLPRELPLLLGEAETMSYGELQAEIGRLIHDEDWQTWEIPKPLATVGAWVEDNVLDEDAFIRPWMVDVADDHYALDIGRARTLLGWQPRRSLRGTLPRVIAALKADPAGWYGANKLNPAKVPDRGR